MSRPMTSSGSLQSRFPATQLDTSTIASAVRQRSSSTASREQLLDSSTGEKALANDPKTRKDWAKFAHLVDRTLQSFESVSEWADFITFLGKLLKCLQAFPNFAYIPHKLVVAKRLAQCLNPALPTGVHQRALDVYVHILSAIGPDNLRRDLQLWSSGLFPFFQYAATSVRPIVLGIYSKFYIPLQEALRPATKALILALLPGLEEETGEFFEKVSSLLDQLSGTVSPSFFLQNIWLVLITAPSLRIAALNYLSRRMPKIGSEDSIVGIVGDDVGLMVRGFSAALEDNQVLVQRAALDLVLATLRTDGAGFQQDTRREEQLLLMRAMTSVVLRRDLSLSRRLYSWLLGPSEESEAQVAHLKKYGLSLLRDALVEEIDEEDVDSGELLTRQKPYKVVLSLLDKWEISYPLTEVIALDVLRALNRSIANGDLHDEMQVTATTLFDGLDPYLVWRQLFLAAQAQLSDAENAYDDALDLVAFVIHTFRLSEDEVTKLHAPLMAFSLLDLVKTAVESPIANQNNEDLVLAIHIAHALLKETSPSFFTTAEQEDSTADSAQAGIAIAGDFYSAEDNKTARVPTTGFAARLVKNGFMCLLQLVQSSLQANSKDSELLPAALNLLSFLADRQARDQPIQLEWQPQEWLSSLLSSIASIRQSALLFEAVEAAIQTLVALNAAPLLPSLVLDRRIVISSIVERLLDFLQRGSLTHHVQAVALLWAIQDLSKYKHVEAVICQRLASPDLKLRQSAYAAFGNLWRFTEDSLLPGVRLSVPMRIMLDALRSEDLAIRQAGEGWMRCSIKSYLRILDPLMCILLDPKIRRSSRIVKLADAELKVEQYDHVFNMAQQQHVLENLLSVTSFGGQGFTRLAKASYLKQSVYAELRSRSQAAGLEGENYLDALCKILVKLLISDAAPSLAGAIDTPNQHIYAIAADLLQVIISRGDLDLPNLQAVETALVTRLYLCVQRSQHDLQNKLLHVLHSTIAAISNMQKRKDRRSTISEKQPPRLSVETPLGLHDPLLVKLLCEGIATQKNSAVLHHWVDFLLMTLPHFRNVMNVLLFPLIDRIAARLTTFLDDMQLAYDPNKKGKGRATDSDINDADFAILLNALERLFVVALEESKTASAIEEDNGSERPQTADGHTGGFLGYISTALGAADGQHGLTDTLPKSKALITVKLAHFVRLLLGAWNVSSHVETLCDSDDTTSQGYTSTHVKARTRKALERIYKTNQTDVLESMVELWDEQRHSSTDDAHDRQERLFQMLDHLSSSAQSVVSMLIELISAQFGSDKGKLAPTVPTSYETLHFEFLDAFITRLDPPAAVQIWPSVHNFSKDIANSPTMHKYRLLPALKCLTTLCEKIALTSALEDRRMRRDLQETFMKLVDATIQMSGRSGAGLQRPQTASTASESTATTPMEPSGGEKMESSMFSEKSVQVSKQQDSAKELATFLARRTVPNFRRFNIDNDKLATTCGNIMYYNVAPAFKTRTRSFEIDDSILELLSELTKVPAALKSWRSQVLEVFSDNRFFYGPPSMAIKWKPIVQALVASDKERFPDLIARISATTSANIFVNRELESLSKAISIRRLSYTIFCGEKNRYLVQLPGIQEKVVELLRAQVSDLVHSEVYLCLRVLLCRIGNQHLSSFWPIILTELLRLFETLMHDSATASPEYLQLILSACKFLDLLLVFQTEEFQIHQWMFITDTVDAVYPPESWTPQATMDRLGEIISQRQDLVKTPGIGSSQFRLSHPAGAYGAVAPEFASLGNKKKKLLSRPLLGEIRQSKIQSLNALEPFFSRASLANYEAVYAMGGVDWSAVERSTELDLFEGDESH